MNAQTMALIASALVMTGHCIGEYPASVGRQAQDLLDQRAQAASSTTATPDRFFAELEKLGTLVPSEAASTILQSPRGAQEAVLGVVLHVKQGRQSIDLISTWYGRAIDEIPSKVIEEHARESWIRGGRKGALVIPAYPKGLAQGSKMGMPNVHWLLDEHAAPELRLAWEAWLMAPRSRERDLMNPVIYAALSRIRDARSIPLLVETFKVETTRVLEEQKTRDPFFSVQPLIERQLVPILRTIHSVGGKEAVLGLLACVRDASGKGLPSDGTEGIPRRVVRLFSSRNLYADRHPGEADVKPADNQWRDYLPMIRQVLANPKELTPGDVTILEQALEAMPRAQ
jgi:hypothetical protein